MIPAPFDYHRAESVEEALALLAEHGDEAKLLAGGHSLLPLMKLRLAAARRCSSTSAGSGSCRYVRDGGDHVAVGALTRHGDLETQRSAARQVPLLAQAAGTSATPRCATGERSAVRWPMVTPRPICPHAARPRGDLVARGPGGEREIGAADFFGVPRNGDGARRDAHRDPRPEDPDAGWSFQKFNRRAQDWAIVGVAAVVDDAATGVALVNMGSTPLGRRRDEALAECVRRGGRCGGRRGPSRPATSTRATSTASTWPGCSCAGHSSRPAADLFRVGPGARSERISGWGRCRRGGRARRGRCGGR